MKKITLALSMLFFAFQANAQLADGSIAPDFTATDINGNTVHLNDYLAAGKTVILDISATWCAPCWAYHNGHTLEDMLTAYGPEASNEVVVLFVEGDHGTTLDNLYGIGNVAGQPIATQGNWVAGSEYPIIDDNSTYNINDLYQVAYFPTVYRICPSGVVKLVDQASATSLKNGINNTCGIGTMTGKQNYVHSLENETRLCTTSGNPVAKIRNFGVNAVTSATVQLKENGSVVATQTYTGNAVQFATKFVTFDTVTVNPASTYTAEITTVNTAPNLNPAFAIAPMNLFLAAQSTENVVVKVYTDNYPSEISWNIINSVGTVVATGGPYTANGTNPGGPDANTTKTQNVSLPSGECYTVQLNDGYGDGWNEGSTPHGLQIFSDANVSLVNIPANNFGTSLAKPNVLTTTALGTPDFAEKKFGLYPNPSTGIIQINTDSTVKVAIMDVTGKVVYTASNVTNQTAINLSGLQKGMYIAKITGDNASTTEKVILK